MTIEETPGGIAITNNGVCLILNAEHAFELLCWLDESKQQLYRASQHPDEEEQMHLAMQQGIQQRYNLRDFTQERYQEFADEQAEHSDEPAYTEQEWSDAVWHTALSQARMQAMEDQTRRYNMEMDARLARQLEARDKPWLPIQPRGVLAMMTKQEALQVLAKYLPPPVLAEVMKAWWKWSLDDPQAQASIFFKSAEHQQRFLTALREIGKIYDGKLDPEYAAALYILTADLSTWKKASDYVDRDGIDIPAMLEEVDFSGGYSVLVMLAGNLFNSQTHIDPVELMRLDESNFTVALTALQVRRSALLEREPQDDPQSVYAAMEAALQLLSGQILSLRTELLVVKALVAKDDDPEAQSEQEYEDTRKYMEHHYEGGE